jgi:hypothetical protein
MVLIYPNLNKWSDDCDQGRDNLDKEWIVDLMLFQDVIFDGEELRL